jgi:hypothetical protein
MFVVFAGLVSKLKFRIKTSFGYPWSSYYLEDLCLESWLKFVLYSCKFHIQSICFSLLFCKVILPPYQNICRRWLFLITLIIHIIQKNYVNIIYFVCDMLYYYRYFKHDLTFCMFAINFWIRRMVKVVRKNQRWQIFWYEGNTITEFTGMQRSHPIIYVEGKRVLQSLKS